MEYVDATTGKNKPATVNVDGGAVVLNAFAVGVVVVG